MFSVRFHGSGGQSVVIAAELLAAAAFSEGEHDARKFITHHFRVDQLNLNPVIARADGVHTVDAGIKITPYQAQDPFLRKLR